MGFTKFGTSGTNNSHRSIVNLVNKSQSFPLTNTSQLTGGQYYTIYGITYPEGNYVPAVRDGITPGFNNISAGKTYEAGRDVNYFVFDEETNTWVSTSYFNGLRISGHCYDTYNASVRDSEHAKFQADYDNIKNTFPNATHIVIGSHASENVDDDDDTVIRLKEIGFPDDHIGLGRVEFILAGKVNKPQTHNYVRENVSSAVAHMNLRLPLEGLGGSIVFDGTDDYISLGNSSVFSQFTTDFTISAWAKRTNSGGSWGNVIGDYYTNNVDGEWQLAMSNGGAFFFFRVGSGYIINATENFGADRWHYVVVTRVGSTITMYVNGNSVSTATNSMVFGSASGNVNVGIDGNNSSEPFTGEISVVKIYNRGLSTQEVEQNYNAYKNRFDI
jgi:hypothetical protein